MKEGSFSKYKLILVIIFLLLIPNLYAQNINSELNANANGNGNGVDPFALTVTTSDPASLNFGTFVIVNGGNIEIDPLFPNSIPITNPGDFIVIKNGSGPILFEVSNNATPLKVVNLIYQVTPITDGTTNLDLTVKFNSSRPLTSSSSSTYTFTVNELNPATIYMGGILNVPAGTLPGNYAGSVTVNIAYP